MNRNKRRLYFSLFMLFALLLIAFLLANNSGWFNGADGTNKDPLSEFTIKDTIAISQIKIAKSTGESVDLKKNEKGEWLVNNKYKARPESIHLIMKTFYHIRVKSHVGAAARANVIKNISVFHRKVEVFMNGEWYKTWYVGNPTADRTGTFMLLETPENGKSTEPYITELAGFHGQLDIRFFTEEEEWKYTGIFNYNNVNDIKEIKVTNHEKNEQSFTLQLPDGEKPILLDYNGAKVSGFDTLMVRAYLYGFRKVHYENTAKLLKYKQIDSLQNATPFYTLEVNDKQNNRKKIKIYHMANIGKAEDLDGKLYQYNPERAYAILPTGDVVVVQFFTFDKLLRPISGFLSNKKTS